MLQAIFSGGWIMPVVIVVIILGAFLVLMKIVANNYIKVPPSRAAVFYGRKSKDGTRGYRFVTGGSKVKIPLVESVDYLDLNIISIDLNVVGAPNVDGVQVTIKGVANIKIISDESSLINAAERFLGMRPDEIRDIAYKNLEGHLRAIVGQLKMEELINDRSKFNQKVLAEAGQDLQKFGLGIDVLTIQEISDTGGYLEALGKKRTAEVKKDASIGEANAKREESIQTSAALREGREAELKNQEAVAEAERNLAIKKANFKAETDTAQAKADQAGPLAQAESIKAVKQAQVASEEAETEARIGLAEKESTRKEKELVATVIKPAEAEKRKKIVEAEATETAATHEAAAVETAARAEKEKRKLEGEGAAEATKAGGLAEAEVKKAGLLAIADGRKADLLAEAEGKEKLALALAKLDNTGKLLQVLEELPNVIDRLGNALSKTLGPDGAAAIFGQIAAPLGSIDEIKILDMGSGGNGSNGGSPVNRLASVGPDIVFNFIKNAKALGLGSLLEKLGINSTLVDEFISNMSPEKTDGRETGSILKKEAEGIHVQKMEKAEQVVGAAADTNGGGEGGLENVAEGIHVQTLEKAEQVVEKPGNEEHAAE